MSMYLSEVYGKGGIYAKVVAASIANGIPIYTLETKAPKFIDAEFEKHRMLSSNSSSSRAIPFKVPEEAYLPFDIRMNQKGMQGYAEHPDADEFRKDVDNVLTIVYEEVAYWHKQGVHKQHLNRYIEPWMYQVKVVTATEWDNFFRLRLAPDAQPEIQELARCMKKAMEQVEPKELVFGGWHLPYILTTDSYPDKSGIESILTRGDAIKCSVARCARVSYKTHDKKDPTVEKDLELYDQLLSSKHMTPFEHQATPMLMCNGIALDDYGDDYLLDFDYWSSNGTTHMDKKGRLWSGNFRGFIQHRQLVEEWNG